MVDAAHLEDQTPGGDGVPRSRRREHPRAQDVWRFIRDGVRARIVEGHLAVPAA